MALDLFLSANGVYLMTSNEDSYLLAKRTAEANAAGRSAVEALREINEKIEEESLSLEWMDGQLKSPSPRPDLREVLTNLTRLMKEKMQLIRDHPLNKSN